MHRDVDKKGYFPDSSIIRESLKLIYRCISAYRLS